MKLTLKKEKQNMKNIFKYGMMAVASVLAVSCDWTDPEPVGVDFDSVEDVAPDAYQQYLSNLRAYRTNGHKKAYAWFTNKASFNSQADHVSAVPDSIDVLVLGRPDVLPQSVIDEMNEKRSNTGMQMAYVVDYAVIKKSWDNKKELETPEAPVPAWTDFMADSVKVALGYFGDGGFDRLIVAYDGKDMSANSEADKAAYIADQQAFLNPFIEWRNSHMDKGFDFMGIPANINDPSFLANAGVIFLSESASATNVNELNYIMSRNSVNGVPADRFAMMAALPVLDPTQASVGYWGNTYASWDVATWSRASKVAAMGMTNLADDYYNPSFVYPVCRQAMQLLNPSAK